MNKALAFSGLSIGAAHQEEVSEQVEEALPATAAIVSPDVSHCRQCGGEIHLQSSPHGGRRPRFCSSACREAARLRRQQGLSESTPKVKPGGRRRLYQRLQLEEIER